MGWKSSTSQNQQSSMSHLKKNKTTFKRTRSLSNAVCFTHHNNVCACAVSALIVLPVVNLSLKINSATSISSWHGKFCRSTPLSPILAIFHYAGCAHAQFRPYYYFRLKIWRHIWILRTRFPIKTRSFQKTVGSIVILRYVASGPADFSSLKLIKCYDSVELRREERRQASNAAETDLCLGTTASAWWQANCMRVKLRRSDICVAWQQSALHSTNNDQSHEPISGVDNLEQTTMQSVTAQRTGRHAIAASISRTIVLSFSTWSLFFLTFRLKTVSIAFLFA